MKNLRIKVIGVSIMSIIILAEIISHKNKSHYQENISTAGVGIFFNLIMTDSENTILALKINKAKAHNLYITETDSAIFLDNYGNMVMEFNENEESIFEEQLEMENWMLEYNWIEKETIIEEELQIEAWMTSPENWKN